ncbi:sodium/bile acid cotransporter 5-like [Microtus oregoni]|uniref:sodium/bile acid cotransporter 5-like n=1 Tax=Microtus oregoni TaxID=111838 RepID=UPI001BB1D5D3|nr:sodium/bile acid cotransporter 5-like [Microtus oregoni]
MFGKSFVILLLLVTPGEARKSFLSFLNVQNSEILSFTKTKEAVIVRSSYKDKRPDSSYLFVKVEDPKVLQVVNVTKTSWDVTDFTLSLKTFPGETNMTIQLWTSEACSTAVSESEHQTLLCTSRSEITWQQNGPLVLKSLSYLTVVLKKQLRLL